MDENQFNTLQEMLAGTDTPDKLRLDDVCNLLRLQAIQPKDYNGPSILQDLGRRLENRITCKEYMVPEDSYTRKVCANLLSHNGAATRQADLDNMAEMIKIANAGVMTPEVAQFLSRVSNASRKIASAHNHATEYDGYTEADRKAQEVYKSNEYGRDMANMNASAHLNQAECQLAAAKNQASWEAFHKDKSIGHPSGGMPAIHREHLKDAAYQAREGRLLPETVKRLNRVYDSHFPDEKKVDLPSQEKPLAVPSSVTPAATPAPQAVQASSLEQKNHGLMGRLGAGFKKLATNIAQTVQQNVLRKPEPDAPGKI